MRSHRRAAVPSGAEEPRSRRTMPRNGDRSRTTAATRSPSAMHARGGPTQDLTHNACASVLLIPRGSDLCRRPRTTSAACDRSALNQPLNEAGPQKRSHPRHEVLRRAERHPRGGLAQHRARRLTRRQPTNPPGPSPSANQRACLTQPTIAPAARPRSASRYRSNENSRRSICELVGAGCSGASTPRPSSTSTRHTKPGRDHSPR